MNATLASTVPVCQVPLSAAPEISDYPQFKEAEVPKGSGASCAWEGFIQPFEDDLSARRVLHCIEGNLPVDVREGTISSDFRVKSPHWADALLVKMDVRFHVLILNFEGTEHPRAYGMQPEISRNCLAMHPHLRTDKMIQVGRQELPALCVYSGAEFDYLAGWPRTVQFLDQTAIFLARHLIWLRTRMQVPVRFGEPFHIPLLGEIIFDAQPRLQTDLIALRAHNYSPRWVGYWPGMVAASGATGHYFSIKPSRECWCWSGKKYGECHRPMEEVVALHSSAQ